MVAVERRTSVLALSPLLAALLVPAGLAGCGSSSTPVGQPTAQGTVGAAGGTIVEPSGAEVVVPAGAMVETVTIAVTEGAAGAPALPGGIVPKGSTYAITPHGGAFAAPVEVRIPAPEVTLQPNERLLLAKADPDGAWTILDGTALVDGKLVAEVTSFSFFTGVVIGYSLPVAQAEPFTVSSATVKCGSVDCGFVVDNTGPVFTVRTNGGQLPATCDSTSRIWLVDERRPDMRVEVGLEGGELRTTSVSSYASFVASLECRLAGATQWNHSLTTPGSMLAVRPYRAGAIPAIGRVIAPPALVPGQVASIAAWALAGPEAGPTQADQAWVEWLRSDDDGQSWRHLATSFQVDATQGQGAIDPWAAWRVEARFQVATEDHGARLRPRVCYARPASTAPACDLGASVTLTVLQSSALPAITEPPRPVLVRTGQPATFTATASGTPAPALRWQTRPANSTGAWADVTTGTGAATGSYTTAPLTLADNGVQFRVVATSAVGTAESPAVTASVSDLDVAPTITTQPAGLSVAAGGDAVFAVVARGTEVLTYQWRLGGAPIPGATATVLRLAAVGVAQAGDYSVVVTNAAGSATSATATLTVTSGAPQPTAPTIVTQPAAAQVGAGNTATFAVGVAGTGPFTYQWRKDGAPIAGATLAYLTIPAVVAGDAGSYSVVVSSAAGQIASAGAALTVLAPAPAVAPAITTQPAPQVQPPGGSATFAVAASGTGPLSYQWTKGGAPIPGATGPVLLLSGLSAADEGSYAVTVSNAAGQVTSAGATLTVLGAPVITTHPAAVTVTAGGSATFEVTAAGAGLRYQWLRNGVPVNGATSAKYVTAPLTDADGGAVFAVVVSNAAGLAVSQGAVLTVTAAPPSLGLRSISSLWRHTCAITTSGELACWGRGLEGQLGQGAAEDATSPVLVSGLGEVLGVSAGVDTTCAISAGGALACWGGMNDSLTPALVDLGDLRATSVAVGGDHACAATGDGGASCWSWGPNDFGELGDGSTGAHATPAPVLLPDGSPLKGVVSVAAGWDFSCAQLAGGEAYCWGKNIFFAGRPAAERVVLQLPNLQTMDFFAGGRLEAGTGHACVPERDSGATTCWGFNANGELGDATTISRDYARTTNLFGRPAVIAGETHSCGIHPEDVICWGTAHFGAGKGVEQLLYPAVAGRVTDPTGGVAPVVAGAAGHGHTCVLRTSGDVQCWGVNDAGQLGVGDLVERTVPTSTAGALVFAVPAP